MRCYNGVKWYGFLFGFSCPDFNSEFVSCCTPFAAFDRVILEVVGTVVVIKESDVVEEDGNSTATVKSIWDTNADDNGGGDKVRLDKDDLFKEAIHLKKSWILRLFDMLRMARNENN